ncbi:MAG: hypothetical protein JWL83_3563 [Actinomycetia bacterium]|nr:hypothetical protein [Actinomycetes bacterium]
MTSATPRIALGIATLVVALLAAPTAAGAGTLEFGGGTAPAISDFTGVTLNGAPQLTSLTVAPFSVNDTTLSGAGWNVTLSIPDLVNAGSTIPASTFVMGAPVVTASGGADITNVVGHASSGNFAAGEKVVTAAVGFGDGTYLVSPKPVMVVVPINAIAGTYTSSATIAVVSGP